MAITGLIAGAENLIDARIAYARANGLSYRVGDTYRVPNAPWRFVAHTMEAPEDDPDTPNLDEGWELPQLKGYIIRHRTPPHLWAAPEHDWVGQTVPLNLSAYALRHERDDPETNHAHAIQLELIGYARDNPYMEDPDWIGRRILKPIIDAGVPININVWAASAGSAAYGENGIVRMSWDEWKRFNGLCGHQNVPGNSHWDPGVVDWARISRAASGAAPIPTPVPLPQEDHMFILERNDASGYAPWLVGGGPPRRLSIGERDAYRKLLKDGKPYIEKFGVDHAQLMTILNSEAKRHGIELP